MSNEQRLIDLESTVAHLQHDLDQLNGALVDQGSELEVLKQNLQFLELRLNRLETGGLEPGGPTV